MIKALEFLTKKPLKSKSFFDLSSKEKKRIVKKAAKESNKMQKDLIAKYKKSFSI